MRIAYVEKAAATSSKQDRPVVAAHQSHFFSNQKSDSTKSSHGGISRAELSLHNRKGDAWTAVRGVVYDVTDFISKHPGGQTALIKILGQDGTRTFGSLS